MEQLINQMPASDVLALFIEKYNSFVTEFDDVHTERDQLRQELDNLKEALGSISMLKSQLEGYKRQATEQRLQLDVATTALTDAQAQVKEREKLLQDERRSHEKTLAALGMLTREKNRLDNELGHLRDMNPQRLKKQNTRLSEKNESYSKRITQLEKESSDYRRAIRLHEDELKSAAEKIRFEQANAKLNSAVRIYKDGDHHLITWPQLVDMKLTDGSHFKQKPLLYVHQSGVSSMLTINPDERELQISKAPKGGLRPPKVLLEKATQWLYDVNIIRNGIMQESDFMEM